MNSAIGKLGLNDFAKGLIVTVLSAVLTIGVQMLQTGAIDLKQIGTVAATTACAYILKQLGTDEEGKALGKIG